ncbi:TPA: hypothetical protein ACN7OD_003089 [Klebsiella pneumoniae]|uniref:hypothetical protein n=1 Tax=Klebsiella pneumoniae complex TaxID=3390273 RepID=UPI0015F2C671|nr:MULTISPECIES: hypothetical protein [Klebsiella]MCB4628456.1 hypothetical protein [Klebsiella pneumoniae]MCB4633386.1 hypothetical protein [Klebsiella pneumoniae]MCQ0896206.1 hypothetical protein [Klebsiella pneumoniae]GKK22809.1 hypothetical protein NUBL10698_36040 [Klebsiella pneumoniae]GKK76258.1 hypothetical protein NUBL10708_15470 [Klebsiella pneumoniae]
MKKLFLLSALSTAILAPAASFAAEGDLDLSSLTDTFSVAPVIAGVLAIAGVLLTLYAAMRGSKIVLALVRGG